MFERYLERARRVLFFSRYEASQLGSLSIEPPHLLLGILREGSAVTASVLDRCGFSAESVRDEIVRLAGPASHPVSGHVEIPFSVDTKRVLGYAAEEADRLHVGNGPEGAIDSDHLLLGVFRLQSPATALFSSRGVTIDDVRALVAKQSYDPPPPRGFVPPPPRPVSRDVAPIAEEVLFEVRISPTRIPSGQHGSTRGSSNQWTLEGIDLASALSAICGDRRRPIETAAHFPLPFPLSRIELDPSLDQNARYDFQVYGRNLDRDFQKALLRLGIEQYFNASVVREERVIDVYVLTAIDSRLEQTAASDFGGGGFGTFSSMTHSGPPPESLAGLPPAEIVRRLSQPGGRTIGSISADGASMHIFCHMLEMPLGRPLINETGLTGTYNIQMPEMADTSSFFERLERELGLKLTEARRSIPFIVLRKN
jgi:uncharacterized protein (TIGR03435 family)